MPNGFLREICQKIQIFSSSDPHRPEERVKPYWDLRWLLYVDYAVILKTFLKKKLCRWLFPFPSSILFGYVFNSSSWERTGFSEVLLLLVIWTVWALGMTLTIELTWTNKLQTASRHVGATYRQSDVRFGSKYTLIRLVFRTERII